MPNLSAGALAMFGIFVGVILMLMAFLFVVGTKIKVPGGGATVYWSTSALLILVSLPSLIYFRGNSNFFLGMFLYSGLIASLVIGWWGFSVFDLREPSAMGWKIGAGFMGAYAILLIADVPYAVRLMFYSVSALVMWPMFLREVMRNWPGKYGLGKSLIVTGGVITIANNALRLYSAFLLSSPDFNFGSPEWGRQVAIFALTMIGGVIYSFGLIILFFERVLEHTRHRATHDELTGLLNRRAIFANGEREVELAQRAGRTLAVAFIDIDFFKQINDEYGHDKGDLVLREVAQVLALNCRRIDLIGRYGGEEFCMIFPGEDETGARRIGERLVSAVGQYSFDGLLGGVTISVGLAVKPANDVNLTWHALVHKADDELFKAKRSGRNKYCINIEAPAEGAFGFLAGAGLATAS